MEYIFDVQRSTLAEFILGTCTTYKKTSCIQYRSAYVPSIIKTTSNLYRFWKGISFYFQCVKVNNFQVCTVSVPRCLNYLCIGREVNVYYQIKQLVARCIAVHKRLYRGCFCFYSISLFFAQISFRCLMTWREEGVKLRLEAFRVFTLDRHAWSASG